LVATSVVDATTNGLVGSGVERLPIYDGLGQKRNSLNAVDCGKTQFRKTRGQSDQLGPVDLRRELGALLRGEPQPSTSKF